MCQIVVFTIVRPFIKFLIVVFVRMRGIPIAFNADMVRFFTSMFGILLIIILAAIGSLAIYYEFAVVVIYLHAGMQKRKINLRYGLKAGLCTVPSLFSFGSIGFVLYATGLIPLLHIGIRSAILPEVNIPSFIIGEIGKYPGGNIALWLVGALLAVLLLKLLFVIPAMVLEKCSFTQGVKRSFRLMKGHTLYFGLVYLIVIVFYWCLNSLLGYFKPDPLSNVESISDIATAILSVLSTPISFAVILICYVSMVGLPAGTSDVQVEQVSVLIHDCSQKMKQGFLCLIRKSKNCFMPVWNSLAPEWLKKRPYYLLSLMLVPFILLMVYAGSQYYDPFTDQCLVVGHRGSLAGVENTVQAVEDAIRQNADYAEIDVMLSQDNIPIVTHDSNLFRLCGSQQKVYERSASDLTALTLTQNGFEGHLATLDNICEVADGRIGLMVELKSHGHETISLVNQAVAIIKRTDMQDSCVFVSSEIGLLSELREKYPEFRTGYIVIGEVGQLNVKSVRKLPVDVLSFEDSVITRSLISICHRASKEVYAWTVNDENVAKEMIALQIEGIISDYPNKMLITVKRREEQ
jgi:glycerophosphoryl diester phosphodiesterase